MSSQRNPVPRLTAGALAAFAHAPTPRAKVAFVRRMIAAEGPDYEPPPDYWYRLRSPLIAMIRWRRFGDQQLRAALAKAPKDRLVLFERILTGFCANWPKERALPSRRPRLRFAIGDLAVSCLPHATVQLDDCVYYLRFLYPLEPQPSSRAITEFEILRRATDHRATPGLLHVATGTIVRPRIAREVGQFVDAEAEEYVRLWQRHRGS